MVDKAQIKAILQQILQEELQKTTVKKISLASVLLSESDRLETGNPKDRVYTHDILTLQESPEMGCGIMEMERTTFPWTLTYDEIDYVIEGTLEILIHDTVVTAGPGELIFIPKGSNIRFSVKEHARFLYITAPADWKNQKETG